MYKQLITASALLLLTAPAFGASATFKTVERADNFYQKCLSAQEKHAAQIFWQNTAEPGVTVMYWDDDPPQCTPHIAEICKQHRCNPPTPPRK
jgi:hypothetical protein